MKLYSLDYSTDYYVNGEDHQLFGMFDGELGKLFIRENYPNIEFPLKFELSKKAKLTDCLSQGNIASGGFVVNEKVKKLLSDFNLMQHKYYPIMLIDEKSGLEIDKQYYWLQINENLTDEIDYQKSIFYETNGIYRVKETTVSSLGWYKSQKEEKGWRWDIEAEKIKIKNNSKLKQFDLFRFFPFDGTICISERLKTAIQDAKLTGFEMEEYDKIKFQD